MPTTEKLSITLPLDVVSTIKERVRSGAEASTSEVIRDAMRVWQRCQGEHAARIAVIRERVRRSLDDPDPDLEDGAVTARIDALHAHTLESRRRGDDGSSA